MSHSLILALSIAVTNQHTGQVNHEYVPVCAGCGEHGPITGPGSAARWFKNHLKDAVDPYVELPPLESLVVECNRCRRQSGSESLGYMCRMAQPDGSTCPGAFVRRPSTTQPSSDWAEFSTVMDVLEGAIRSTMNLMEHLPESSPRRFPVRVSAALNQVSDVAHRLVMKTA